VPQTQIEMYRKKNSMLTQIVQIIMRVAASLPAPTSQTQAQTQTQAGAVPPPAFFLLVELGASLLLLRVLDQTPRDALLLR
jgi:hypothetical protein